MVSRTKKAHGKAGDGRGGAARQEGSRGTDAGKPLAKGEDLGAIKHAIPALRERRGVSSTVLRQVGLEVLRQDLEPAAWAQALVEGSGTRDDTLSHYARVRVEALTEQERERQNRKSDFESRRRSSFQDMDSVPVAEAGSVVRRRVMGCVDAVFWHVVAMVAGVGTLVAANLLWPGLHLKLSWQFLVLAVVAMQLIPFVGWRAGRGGRKGVTYSQASQIAACLAMLGSVGMGLGLLTQHPPDREPLAGPDGPRLERGEGRERLSSGDAPGRGGDFEARAIPASTKKVASSDER